MPIFEHHQNTAEISYSADKIDFTDVLLVHQQTIEALRELLDARTALRLNQVTLESIAGWPVTAAHQIDTAATNNVVIFFAIDVELKLN
jgi:outer membrane protein, heavy metal efflux system